MTENSTEIDRVNNLTYTRQLDAHNYLKLNRFGSISIERTRG
jgi:hypothetical protein